MASPPPSSMTLRTFLAAIHIIAQMMGLRDASIGSATASTNFDTCPSTQVDCSDIDDSNSSLSTAAEEQSEDENDTSPASNLGSWHYIKGNLKKIFTKWQKYGALEDCESYEVITDKGTFFTVKEISLLDEGHEDIWRSLQLEQEIEFLKQLEHENIVQYLGSEKDNEKLYVFLELMSRGSLSTFYRKYGSIESQASTHTRKVLEALKYLHGQNVTHRDIRCAKILVGASGSVKLDFGLANAIGSNDTNSFRGTIFWMAPEVVRNGRNGSYGSAADIWSLGCTVLEMLTNNRPYSEFGDGEASERILEGVLPEIPENLSRDAQDFIRKCLRVNPQDRPSAVQLLGHPFVRRPTNQAGSASPCY